MLEAGLVRNKNTAEILTKNITLFSIVYTCYLVVGYELMIAKLKSIVIFTQKSSAEMTDSAIKSESMPI